MKAIIQTLETWLWSESGSFFFFRRILQCLYRIVIQYQRANFKERAQALTYTTMLSLVPLMAITFSILAAFGVHNELEPLLRTGLAFLGEESANDFAHTLIGFVENTRGIILGGVGFVVLLYTAVNLMTTVESAFNRIWRVERGRPFRERMLSYMIVILVGPIFAFIAFSFLSSSIVVRVSGYVTNPVVNFLLGQAFTISVVTFVIWLAYLFITYRKVNVIPALIGAFFASNAWYFVGKLFTQFVVLSGKQSEIYSGFASVVLFIMWVYLSWIIILIGSQIAYYLQFRDKIAHDDELSEKPTQVEVTLCLEAKDIDRQEWYVKRVKSESIDSGIVPGRENTIESMIAVEETPENAPVDLKGSIEVSTQNPKEASKAPSK
ncbi:YihY/virulence factor BrkB family protein [Ignatzschineria sp. LJL83]